MIRLFDIISERTLLIYNDSDEEISGYWITIFSTSVEIDKIFINGAEITDYVTEDVDIDGEDPGIRIVFGTPDNPINPIPGNSAAIIILRCKGNVDLSYYTVGWQPESKQPLFGYN